MTRRPSMAAQGRPHDRASTTCRSTIRSMVPRSSWSTSRCCTSTARIAMPQGKVLGENAFSLERFQGQDSASDLFEYQLELHGDTAAGDAAAGATPLDFATVIGRPVTVGIGTTPYSGSRRRPARVPAGARRHGSEGRIRVVQRHRRRVRDRTAGRVPHHHASGGVAHGPDQPLSRVHPEEHLATCSNNCAGSMASKPRSLA